MPQPAMRSQRRSLCSAVHVDQFATQSETGPLRCHLPSGERGARSPNLSAVPPDFESGPTPIVDSLSKRKAAESNRKRERSIWLATSARATSGLPSKRKAEGSNLRPCGPTRVQAGGRATRDCAFQSQKHNRPIQRDRPARPLAKEGVLYARDRLPTPRPDETQLRELWKRVIMSG